MQFGLRIPKLVSELKSDLGGKSYDMGPHVKLMSNPAVVVKTIVSLPPSWKSTIMYAVPIAKF